jgi:signal transduction histidine kinase
MSIPYYHIILSWEIMLQAEKFDISFKFFLKAKGLIIFCRNIKIAYYFTRKRWCNKVSSNIKDFEQTATNGLINFLDNNLSAFLATWQESILLSQRELEIDKATNNGLQMFELVKMNIVGSLSEEANKQLAYKVANERAEGNANFGEFVYNVNLGRSIICKYIIQSGISAQLLQRILDRVNMQFDRFCYHAVTKYSEIKEQELLEKTLLINQNHKDSLSILGQMSSSFVHEFRNPLTAVIGFTKLLKSENPSLKYLDIIDHELEELKFRITQFLHTSKMETMQKEKEEVSIASLFDNLLNFIYPSIVDADVNIETNIKHDVIIMAHKDELKQVLLNIFYNSIDAVKQKKQAKEITVNCIKDKKQLIVNISNNGPIIPPNQIKSIFEPLFTTKELGTGIGLYVCKKIIEKHNGSITCKSNDTLTSFEIRLPL